MTTRSNDHRCPACGETDLLQGRAVDHGIDVTCGGCGHSWQREDRTCATCGGSEVVERDQNVSRNPRGNQIAVVGRRLIRLCPSCDQDALARADQRSGLVEEEYVSRYLLDPHSVDRAAQGRPQRGEPSAPARSAKRPGPVDTPRRETAAARLPSPRPSAPAPSLVTPTDPTLREAISDFLEGPAEPGDALVMLLVGRALGPTTRLSALGPDAADELRRAGGDTTSAGESASRALEHWRSRGWAV